MNNSRKFVDFISATDARNWPLKARKVLAYCGLGVSEWHGEGDIPHGDIQIYRTV